ncbi:MAG: NAD-dependent epimerase/dehydratase family protein [Anaerolineae bacterium]
MKALVTGATGFVGSHVVRTLIAEELQRGRYSPSSKLDALAGLEYESALGDVTELDALRAACDGCDWVFHVAAVADYWRADHTWMREVNVEGRRVLQAARETGVRRGGVHQQRGGGRFPAGSPRRPPTPSTCRRSASPTATPRRWRRSSRWKPRAPGRKS